MRTMWKIAAVLSVITLVFICVMPHANARPLCAPVEMLIGGELFDHEKSQRYLVEYNAFNENGFTVTNISAHQIYVVKRYGIVVVFLINHGVSCRQHVIVGPLLHKEFMEKIEGVGT